MAEMLLSLIGPAIQSGHQSLAAQMQWLQFQDAKRRADKNERFAMATRSDAYGNKQKYDELNNEWSQTLTPLQAAILKAGEKEQYLTVTEDAQRNREIKRAASDRGKEAGKDYKRVLADFRYNQPKGEATIQNELNAISGSTANADAKSAQAKAITAALRAGQGALIPTLIKKTDDAVGAQTT